MATAPKNKKKIKKQTVVSTGKGKIHVGTTFNNTIVTITNEKGDVVAWSSSGKAGFKGTRRSTPYAATLAVESALGQARDVGIKSLDVYIKGPGVGRDAALRALRNSGMSILMIADVTPIPHNGPRGKKRRRT